MKVFSVKRAALSFVLGFLIPLGYALLLSAFFDYRGRSEPQSLVWAFGWPRPIWIFVMGRQPRQEDIVGGIIFMAVCNTLLYGALAYVGLTLLSAVRRKPADYELPPPPPERLSSDAE